ncbi:uncharacterized protein N7511_003709 [Penicillium nucicola]|uniref:uncharacterized protein n=1 Tax=Penicillium nucicola TaxID=1850975 RepID=UPI002544F4A5|nr:uncharacterized protein N7511_003709 [Penicillium nucicola]KAJ5766093.1 hypothetical protein N7511_003709 [Penicillium nucicola]
MASTIPNDVAFNIPVLKGRSNWYEWHRDFLRVTLCVNPLYWDIFTGNVGPPKYHDCNFDVYFGEDVVNNGFTMDHCSQPENDQIPQLDASGKEVREQYNIDHQHWNRFVLEARGYLRFALDQQPAMHIRQIANPREAFLELEMTYAFPHAQPSVDAWKKWLLIHYHCTRESPEEFVNRFKKALQELKGQGVQVSVGVEIAQFQAALMHDLECLHFVDTLVIDPKSLTDTDSVYAGFLQG